MRVNCSVVGSGIPVLSKTWNDLKQSETTYKEQETT